MKQLTLTFKKAGDGLDLSFPVEEEEYDVNMYVTHGPAYGKVRVTQGERTLASVRRVRAGIVPAGKVVLKDVKAVNGQIRLSVMADGKNERSTGYAAGIDVFIPVPSSYVHSRVATHRTVRQSA